MVNFRSFHVDSPACPTYLTCTVEVADTALQQGQGMHGTFSRADFVFDQQRNIYICPGGAELTSTGNIDQGHIVYYRASKSVCSQCSLKPKCTTATVRKITRDLNEDVRDRVRALADTEAFQQSRRERKKVEMRFAHMKRILRLDRFRLRGLSGVGDEVCSQQPRRT